MQQTCQYDRIGIGMIEYILMHFMTNQCFEANAAGPPRPIASNSGNFVKLWCASSVPSDAKGVGKQPGRHATKSRF